MDIATQTLNTFGANVGVAGGEFYDFQTQTIAADTVFFLFANATGSQAVALVDSTGADITNALSLADIGDEAQLNDFSFGRESGADDLGNREVFGNTFAVSEFTFNDGFGVGNVAGFRGQGGSPDGGDAGIAAVPEPASLALLGMGAMALIGRRKKA